MPAKPVTLFALHNVHKMRVIDIILGAIGAIILGLWLIVWFCTFGVYNWITRGDPWL